VALMLGSTEATGVCVAVSVAMVEGGVSVGEELAVDDGDAVEEKAGGGVVSGGVVVKDGVGQVVWLGEGLMVAVEVALGESVGIEDGVTVAVCVKAGGGGGSPTQVDWPPFQGAQSLCSPSDIPT